MERLARTAGVAVALLALAGCQGVVAC
ncbi:MAG: hypothetical protein JWL78_1525, partial [Chloroflexi bacterium]|nr:hypothetical protein [Chloroflexota bacterium]